MLFVNLTANGPIVLIVTLHHAIHLLTSGGWACWKLPHATVFGHYACTPH